MNLRHQQIREVAVVTVIHRSLHHCRIGFEIDRWIHRDSAGQVLRNSPAHRVFAEHLQQHVSAE